MMADWLERKLTMSRAPTNVKSWESTYTQARPLTRREWIRPSFEADTVYLHSVVKVALQYY